MDWKERNWDMGCINVYNKYIRNCFDSLDKAHTFLFLFTALIARRNIEQKKIKWIAEK